MAIHVVLMFLFKSVKSSIMTWILKLIGYCSTIYYPNMADDSCLVTVTVAFTDFLAANVMISRPQRLVSLYFL